MGRIPEATHLAPIAAGIVLVCFVLAKIDAIRGRKRAVEVSGEVLKIFSHRQHTSYFIKYEYEGSTRIAEYAGAPLLREFKEGERIQIMIDSAAPPDVPLPDKWHSSASQGGNCEMQGNPLVSLWDIVVVGVCVYLIARFFVPGLH